MSPNPTARRSRLSATDWITASLRVLETGTVDSVAVEPLAAILGVTKGSFYAHFEARDDLLAAALDSWETEELAQLNEIAHSKNSPDRRLSELLDLMFSREREGRIFAAICASSEDPRVAPASLRVAGRRDAILRDVFAALGMTKTEAGHRAALTEHALIGYWRVAKAVGTDHAGGAAYRRHVKRCLAPSASPNAS